MSTEPTSGSLITVPTGHQEPEPSPEYTAAPEEGTYLWHLQRLQNLAALNLVGFLSALEIRDHQLYQPQYRSWEEFCRCQLTGSGNHINRLIKAAIIAQELQAAGCDPLPRYPSQVRPLSLLRDTYLRVTAWNNACAGKSPGHLPTRADVMREVRRLLPATTVTSAEERQIYRELLARLRAAREQIRVAQAVHSSPEAEAWLADRATIKERRLLRELVEDCRRRLDSIEIDTRIIG